MFWSILKAKHYLIYYIVAVLIIQEQCVTYSGWWLSLHIIFLASHILHVFQWMLQLATVYES